MLGGIRVGKYIQTYKSRGEGKLPFMTKFRDNGQTGIYDAVVTYEIIVTPQDFFN